MGLITWLAGMRPTAAQMQSLDNETINRCTSSTRPADALTVEGMRIWEIDTRRMMVRVPISGIAGTGDGVGGKWRCEPGQTVICANLAGRPIASECAVGLKIYQVDIMEEFVWNGTGFSSVGYGPWANYAGSIIAAPAGFSLGTGVFDCIARKSNGRIEFEIFLRAGPTTNWGSASGAFVFAIPGTWLNRAFYVAARNPQLQALSSIDESISFPIAERVLANNVNGVVLPTLVNTSLGANSYIQIIGICDL
jgi:hypothetical protein